MKRVASVEGQETNVGDNDCRKCMPRFGGSARFWGGAEFTVREEVSDTRLIGSGGRRRGRV